MRKLALIVAVCFLPAAARAQAGTNPPTYFDFQVDSQVRIVPGTVNPKYPEVHKASKAAGEVLAQFVVDANGRAVIETFKVLKATDSLFVKAVRDELTNIRFIPAYAGGQKVRQLVQLPFRFDMK